MAAKNADDILVEIEGRRFGIFGDGETANASGLVLDGKVVATTRAGLHTVFTGRNGVGAMTATGTKVGDTVTSVTNLTTPGDVTSSFESVITVADQIQQSAATDLSAAKLLIVTRPRS